LAKSKDGLVENQIDYSKVSYSSQAWSGRWTYSNAAWVNS